MNDQQDSLNAYRERRITERARVAKLVLVALVAGFVGAGWGYVKGEVAVLTGDSEVASVLLAPSVETQVSATNASATVKVDTSKNGGSVTVSTSGDGAKTGDAAKTQENKNPCVVGGKDECLNKCSASFLDIHGPSTNIDVTDCYGKEGDKAKKAITDLVTCIEKKTKDPKSGWQNYYLHQSEGIPTEDNLKEQLCEVGAPAATADKAPTSSNSASSGAEPPKPVSGAGSTQPPKETDTPKTGSKEKQGKLIVPKDCAKELAEVQKLPGSGTVSGDLSEVKCGIGPVVCSRAGPDEKYTCKAKPKSGQSDPSTTTPTDPCEGKTGVSGGLCKLNQKVDDLYKRMTGDRNSGGPTSGPTNGVTGGSPLGNALGRALGQGLTGQSGSGSNNQQQPQCPAGYTLSNQQPQTTSSTGSTTGYDQYGAYTQPVVYTNNTYVCVPSNQANAQPPQCTFNVSKKNPTKGEKVTLTWSTSNTDNGGKVMLSDGTNSGKIETSGTQDVTINSARTYTLTAYNAKGQTKECKVEITLGGTGEEGTSGAYPPKLSCAPSIIEAGKSATVTWECPTAAKKSAGEGTTTGGAVKGQKTVTPTTNSEYTVSCFSSDTANIDDEESEDFLGKRTCSVRVAKPEFDIIAYPEQAKRGERVRISWGSLFMKTCKVSGPRGFDYTRPNGVVVTEPFSTNEQTAPDRTIRAAVYTITCESLFGKTYSADTEVDFQN